MLEEFFKRLFGVVPRENMRPPDYDDDRKGFDQPPSWNFDSENRMSDFNPVFDSQIVIDPLEMHRMFQKQFNEVFKVLTSPDGISGFFGPDSFGPPNVPAIEGNQDPRDHFLKPGVKKAQPVDESFEDSSKRSGWLGLPEPSFSPQQDSLSQPRMFSSFRSVTRRTVTLPDGTVQTEEVIRNSDGTEERTKSHTQSDWTNRSLFDAPFVNPNRSGFFDLPKMPELKINQIPKDLIPKPGYENFNPHEAKIDKDLDKQILQSGIEILPPFTKEQEIQGEQNFSYKSLTRRLPNGVIETEEIVRHPDGTEKRTITHTQPDGSTPCPGDYGTNNTTKIDDRQVFQSYTLRGLKDLMNLFF